MSNWEVFSEKGTRPKRRRDPKVSIRREGIATMTVEAKDLLGGPDTIQLLYDHDTGRMGVRPADGNDANAYRIAGGGTFSVAKFCTKYGVDCRQPREYRAFLEGDVLVVDLPNPIEPSQ